MLHFNANVAATLPAQYSIAERIGSAAEVTRPATADMPFQARSNSLFANFPSRSTVTSLPSAPSPHRRFSLQTNSFSECTENRTNFPTQSKASVPQTEKNISTAIFGSQCWLAYETQDEFRKGIRLLVRDDATIAEIAAGKCYGKDDIKNLDIAWHVYQSVRNAEPAMVLGRLYGGGIIAACDPNFPCIDQKLVDNFGLISTSIESSKAGGILRVDRWSHMTNDALILGAIHFGKDLYLASPRTKGNVWNEEEQRLTVMGRELIGIMASNRFTYVYGDGRTGKNDLGEAARFNRAHGGANFGFAKYLANIKKYLGNEGLIRSLWETNAKPLSTETSDNRSLLI